MDGLVVNIRNRRLPLVRVAERRKDEWLFQIITSETVIILEEKDAKRLYQQLESAFRPKQCKASIHKSMNFVFCHTCGKRLK